MARCYSQGSLSPGASGLGTPQCLAQSLTQDRCSGRSCLPPIPLPPPDSYLYSLTPPLPQEKSLGSPKPPSPGEIPLTLPSIPTLPEASHLSAQDEEEHAHTCTVNVVGCVPWTFNTDLKWPNGCHFHVNASGNRVSPATPTQAPTFPCLTP